MARPKKSLNDKAQGADSPARLLRAALQIFERDGVNQASIHDICKLADVSIGSAYHHYGSKQGLADALLAEGLRANSRALMQRLDKTRSAEAGVRVMVESLAQWVEENPSWARFIYLRADATGAASALEAMQPINTEYRAGLEQYFAPHLQAGRLRRLPHDTYVSLILGPVHDYARKWLGGLMQEPPSAHAAVFADAAWRAVGKLQ